MIIILYNENYDNLLLFLKLSSPASKSNVSILGLVDLLVPSRECQLSYGPMAM